jgi:thioesterase domain-containing protein
VELFKNQTIEKCSAYIENTTLKVWSPLICLNKTGKKEPIFFSPAIQGIGSVYLGLSKLIKLDRPCYALESRGFSESKTPHSDLIEMAGYYLEEIRKVQKEGPYYLVGWSFGGLLSIEIAQQLISAGQKVRKVILLDASPDTDTDPIIHPDRNNGLSSDIAHTIKETHQQAMAKYKIDEIAFPIALIRAEYEDDFEIQDESLGWKSYIKNSTMDIYSIKSRHDDMLKQATLPELAHIISELLK